jgi:hypothetical protein
VSVERIDDDNGDAVRPATDSGLVSVDATSDGSGGGAGGAGGPGGPNSVADAADAVTTTEFPGLGPAVVVVALVLLGGVGVGSRRGE